MMFLHDGHFRDLKTKPFLIICSGLIFLLQYLHKIVFSNISSMCIRTCVYYLNILVVKVIK